MPPPQKRTVASLGQWCCKTGSLRDAFVCDGGLGMGHDPSSCSTSFKDIPDQTRKTFKRAEDGIDYRRPRGSSRHREALVAGRLWCDANKESPLPFACSLSLTHQISTAHLKLSGPRSHDMLNFQGQKEQSRRMASQA